MHALLRGEFSLEIAYIVNEWPKAREELQNSKAASEDSICIFNIEPSLQKKKKRGRTFRSVFIFGARAPFHLSFVFLLSAEITDMNNI